VSENEKKSQIERDLTFFGVITANVSHDLSNVVCVLHQVSGLLGDLISQSEQGPPIKRERIATIRDRLVRQSERAKDLTEQLNRFAHGIDSRHMEFEVNSVVENLIAVSRRFADLRGLRLKMTRWKEDLSFVGDPFTLQQVLFEGLRRAYELTSVNETVDVSVALDTLGKSVILARPVDPKWRPDVGLAPLVGLAPAVPAKIGLRTEEGRERLLIRLLEKERPGDQAEAADRLEPSAQ